MSSLLRIRPCQIIIELPAITELKSRNIFGFIYVIAFEAGGTSVPPDPLEFRVTVV